MKTRNALIIAGGLAVGLALMPVGYVSAVNYFSTTRVVTGTNTATCPTGYKVVGGGAKGLPADSQSGEHTYIYALKASAPSGTTGWTAAGRKIDIRVSGLSVSMTSTAQNVTAYAVCIK